MITKNFMAIIFVLTFFAYSHASEVTIKDNISYGTTNYLQQNQDLKIKQLQINVNSGGYSDLQPILGVSKINLNNGDTYSIRVKAIDNKWYHTKTLTYHSKLQNNSFTIDGIVTPANLLIGDGVESAVFYDVNGWPAVGIWCTTTTIATRTVLACTFNKNQHGVGKFVGDGGGGFINFYGTGTAHFNPDIIINTEATLQAQALVVYLHGVWGSDKTGIIGYADLGGAGIGASSVDGHFK